MRLTLEKPRFQGMRRGDARASGREKETHMTQQKETDLRRQPSTGEPTPDRRTDVPEHAPLGILARYITFLNLESRWLIDIAVFVLASYELHQNQHHSYM